MVTRTRGKRLLLLVGILALHTRTITHREAETESVRAREKIFSTERVSKRARARNLKVEFI